MFATGAVLDSFQSTAAAPRLVRGAITYVAGSTGAIGTTTLFTVTGDVMVNWITAKATTGLTSGGAPTWSLGVTGNTALLFNNGPNVTGWSTGKWYDRGTPTYATGGAIMMESAITSGVGGIAISADIVQTIASATITGGVVRWYLQYIPLSGDGLVTLHANLTAF